MVSISEDKDTEYDLGEKDVTTYLLRRNMATHLYTLGFTVLESQYFMGHKMEGTALKDLTLEMRHSCMKYGKSTKASIKSDGRYCFEL